MAAKTKWVEDFLKWISRRPLKSNLYQGSQGGRFVPGHLFGSKELPSSGIGDNVINQSYDGSDAIMPRSHIFDKNITGSYIEHMDDPDYIVDEFTKFLETPDKNDLLPVRPKHMPHADARTPWRTKFYVEGNADKDTLQKFYEQRDTAFDGVWDSITDPYNNPELKQLYPKPPVDIQVVDPEGTATTLREMGIDAYPGRERNVMTVSPKNKADQNKVIKWMQKNGWSEEEIGGSIDGLYPELFK